jgi:hypothetical protein
MSNTERDARVPVLAALLEADFGWAVDAGWEATAASMLAKVDAAPRTIPPEGTHDE